MYIAKVFHCCERRGTGIVLLHYWQPSPLPVLLRAGLNTFSIRRFCRRTTTDCRCIPNSASVSTCEVVRTNEPVNILRKNLTHIRVYSQK